MKDRTIRDQWKRFCDAVIPSGFIVDESDRLRRPLGLMTQSIGLDLRKSRRQFWIALGWRFDVYGDLLSTPELAGSYDFMIRLGKTDGLTAIDFRWTDSDSLKREFEIATRLTLEKAIPYLDNHSNFEDLLKGFEDEHVDLKAWPPPEKLKFFGGAYPSSSYVLGMLYFKLGRWKPARRYLELRLSYPETDLSDLQLQMNARAREALGQLEG